MMKNKVFGIGHLAIGLALWMAAGEAAAQYTNPPGRRVVMNEDPENGIKVAAGPGENLVLGEANNTVIVQGSSMEVDSFDSINLNPGIGSVYLHNRPLRGVLDPTDDTHVGDRGYNNTLYATIAAASNAQETASAASNLAATAVQPAAATNIAQGVVDAAKIVVNVKDYGATGDGVTDDTDAIQSAVDSVESSGGSVYFPSGTYKITSEIIYTPTKGGGSFVGEGEYRTILNQTTATNGFVVRQTGDYDGLEFRNISIAGAGGGIGFSVEGASTALDRLSLSNVRTSGFETGISLLGVSQSLIRNCWSGLNVKGLIIDTGLTGGACNANTIIGGACNLNTATNVYIGGGRAISFIGVDHGGTAPYSIVVDGAANTKFSSCQYEAGSESSMAFYIKAAATLHSLDGCEFLGYDSASTNSPVYAIGVSLALNQNRMTQYASGTPLVRVGTNTRVFGNASHSTYNASSYGYGHVKYETDTLGYAAINQLQNVAATTTITPSQYTRGYMAWRYGTGIGSGDDVQIVWRRSGDGAYILSSLINDKGFYGANVTTQPAAIPDTSADNVSTNEVEINKIKAVLRTWGLIDN